jgi:hypothetical protein
MSRVTVRAVSERTKEDLERDLTVSHKHNPAKADEGLAYRPPTENTVLVFGSCQPRVRREQ